MKSLLILLVIYLVEVAITKARKSRAEKAEKAQREEAPPPPPEYEDNSGSNRNLQDLIRQFENAQRQASQGNIEPPYPPVDEYSDDLDEREEYDGNEWDEEELDEYGELPVVTPAQPNCFTFQEISESVIQWEYVSEDLLQRAFNFSETTARQVLAELQANRIVGHDMGNGICSLLVHDKIELANLLNRLQREKEEQQRRNAEMQRKAEQERIEQVTREDDSRKTRDGLPGEGSLEIGEGTNETPAENPRRQRTFERSEIRRGFIWAKVLDEPRFKKRWNPRVR